MDSVEDAYRMVADDLKAKAHHMRVEAMQLDPRNRDRMRTRAAKLERASRLLLDEAEAETR